MNINTSWSLIKIKSVDFCNWTAVILLVLYLYLFIFDEAS